MILTLLLPALLGWIVALALITYLRKGRWLRTIDFSSVGSLLEKDLLSPEFLKEKLLSPGNYQKLVPQIESHIDHFLRVRLKEDMPVVGMMIGDRTINQMKGIFLKELEQLFPEVMEGYLNHMREENSLSGIFDQKIKKDNYALPAAMIEPFVQQNLIRVQILGVAAGLLSGILQIVIYFLSRA